MKFNAPLAAVVCSLMLFGCAAPALEPPAEPHAIDEEPLPAPPEPQEQAPAEAPREPELVLGLTGQVVGVAGAQGAQLIAVDLGRADGILCGEVLELDSSGTFLGRAKVDQIFDTYCLARVQSSSSQPPAVAGDRARRLERSKRTVLVWDSCCYCPSGPPLIMGFVIAVSESSPPTLVVINKGSIDGVRQGLVFHLYVDTMYYGCARIETVQEASSVGIVSKYDGRIVREGLNASTRI